MNYKKFTWDNGIVVLETTEIAWRIIDINTYSITAMNSYVSDYDATFTFRPNFESLSIDKFKFNAKTFKDANKFVLSFLKQNNISLDSTIYITPEIKKRKDREPKFKRLLK